MAEVTGYTSARMKMIEDETVVDGRIDVDNLILIQRNLNEINAGNVRGPQGIEGPRGVGVPVGFIGDYYGTVPPVDWLECNGASFDGVAYPDLQAHLGGTVLPDLRDKSTIGRSATAAFGTSKGSANALVPQHQHADTLAAPAHIHIIDPPNTNITAPPSPQKWMMSGTGGTPDISVPFGEAYTTLSGGTPAVQIAAFNSGAASATALTGSVGNVSGATVASSGSNYHPVMAVLKCIKARP